MKTGGGGKKSRACSRLIASIWRARGEFRRLRKMWSRAEVDFPLLPVYMSNVFYVQMMPPFFYAPFVILPCRLPFANHFYAGNYTQILPTDGEVNDHDAKNIN